MTSAAIALSLLVAAAAGNAFAGSGPAVPSPADPELAVLAQAAAGQQPASASRLVGAITAIDGKSLTVKPDSGAPTTVTVSDAAKIVRTDSVKDLKSATPIQLTDLAVGDRVLMLIHPTADGSAPIATAVVAMKQADIAQQQQAAQADWQRRGVGGIVKTVDAASGTVTIAAGSRMLTIHATPKTIVRRYDPESIKFADARPSTLDQIHAGDQLRARGDRSPDSSDVTADEIIAGSFRNIAGTVVASDPAANTVTVTDLATKKPVVIHVSADSQLHKLPPAMAQMLAARFKNAGAGRAEGTAAPSGTTATASAPPAGPPSGPPSSASGPPTGPPSENGPSGRPAGGQRSGDLSQFLQRTPALQLSELHKGDAVMIVATQGTPDAATAVTLLAGVEPILTASPSASQNMFSASWSLGGGGAGGEAEGTQ